MIQANRLDDAKRVLADVLQKNPGDNEAIFLRGMIAVAEKDYAAAIADFRRILAAEPTRERVRLELARAFFESGDYDNAERNFRFARAGDLPPEVKANIDQFLAAIVRLKHWSYNLALALADDTNVNGATTVNTVDLYRLRVQTLSDDARQKSGTGVAIDVGGEWSPLISNDTKLRLGVQVHRLQYGETSFDDMTVSSYAGPEFLFARWQIDTLATGFYRWYADAPYSDGVGGRTIVTFVVIPNLQLSTVLDVQNVWYTQVPDQNGIVGSSDIEATYTISPSSVVRLVAGIGAQWANAPSLADTTHWLSLDYYQDLPWGFSVAAEPSYAWTRCTTTPLAAFGVTRADSIWAVRLDVLNRRIEYAGFAPKVSVVFTDQTSNVSLYRYSRTQVLYSA